jgi:DNA-binding CsgD family transcriptional regulator
MCRTPLGAALRRAGHRNEARLALRRANQIFESAGAARWAARSAAELRACGERPPTAPGAPAARLTPQETRVAMLVAQGARSRDVATALFLSERTVESHLAAVYRKLGLRSRAELAAHLAAPAGIRTEVQ